jgi:hypothetical protein
MITSHITLIDTPTTAFSGNYIMQKFISNDLSTVTNYY